MPRDLKIRYRMVALLISMAAAYPLSIGPVLRVQAIRSRETAPLFRIDIPGFYGPLLWVCRRSTTAEKVFEWYWGVWMMGFGK
jgi:hypothetical protein